MTINRRSLTNAVRTLLDFVDSLHRGALLALVLVLVGLAYTVAPFVVALLTALVTVIKAVMLIAGALVLARLAVKAAAEFRSPAPPVGPTTTPAA